MQLTFDSLDELRRFTRELVSYEYTREQATTAAPKKKKAATKKPPKKTPPPEVVAEPIVEPVIEPVGYEEVLAYVQANCADNIQQVKDMLARMGAAKLSDIPEGQFGKALDILKSDSPM